MKSSCDDVYLELNELYALLHRFIILLYLELTIQSSSTKNQYHVFTELRRYNAFNIILIALENVQYN